MIQLTKKYTVYVGQNWTDSYWTAGTTTIQHNLISPTDTIRWVATFFLISCYIDARRFIHFKAKLSSKRCLYIMTSRHLSTLVWLLQLCVYIYIWFFCISLCVFVFVVTNSLIGYELCWMEICVCVICAFKSWIRSEEEIRLQLYHNRAHY